MTVRLSSERAAITGRYLVWRSSWISKENHAGPIARGRQARGDVPGLQHDVHGGTHLADGAVHEEAVREVYMSLRVVCLLPE